MGRDEALVLLVLVHLAATLLMVGIIWFVQVVHYPLFGAVGREGFVAYAADHVRRTGLVVAPLMLVEAATAVALLVTRPASIPARWVWLGFGLLALVWLSTNRLQVPRHRLLGRGFDGEAVRGLVLSNWLRTVAWSGRGVLVLAMVCRLLA